MILLFTYFILKHFVADFLLQFKRHYLFKGSYGAWGGIEHALIHGILTCIVLGPIAGLIDLTAHYHIDWAKMNINKHYNLTPVNSETYWLLLGLDQLLHYLTYCALIYFFA